MAKAFVLINTDPSSEAEVESEFKKIEGIVGVYQVYGVYDLVVEVDAGPDRMSTEATFSKIRALKYVRSMVTLSGVA